MSTGRSGKTQVPGARTGGLDQMLDAVVEGAPDPAASNAFLLVVSGTDPGRLHVLDQQEMVIGRSRFASIHISERALSQQHCKLTRYGEHYRLFDLGSTNGTFVNGVKVQQANLKPGDEIRTGETVFLYKAGGQTASASSSADRTLVLPNSPFVAPGPTTQALARRTHPPSQHAAASVSSTALARRTAPPLITVAQGGYAGAPQILEVPLPDNGTTDSPDLVARILWVINFLRRYWLSILLLTVTGAGLGIASYKFVKPRAKAEFEISLNPDASDNPLERMQRSNLLFFRSAKDNFKRPALIHETLKQLGDTNITPAVIREKQASLEFNQVGELTYKGSFSAPTADDAIDFLDVHLELYRESEINKTLQSLIQEVKTLESELSRAEAQLNSTNQEILAFQQEDSEGVPEKSQFLRTRYFDLMAARDRANTEVIQSRAETQIARRALKNEDPVLEARIEESRPYATNIASINQQLAAARAQGKGSEHPDVKRLEDEKRALVALRDKVLTQGTSKIITSQNPAHRNARLQLSEAEGRQQAAESELARINKQLEEMGGTVDKLPALQAQYTDLSRNQTVIQRSYDDLFTQLESTRIRLHLERSQANARYDVITPPNVIPVSRLKTIMVRAGIGTFLGLFLGLGLGVLREGRRYLAARLAAARR